MSTPGGNGLTVECRGEALGPEVEISRRVISFGDVPIVLPRKSVGRVLEILNHSAAPVPFQVRARVRGRGRGRVRVRVTYPLALPLPLPLTLTLTLT